MNQSLRNILSIMISDKKSNWDEYLAATAFAYNTSVNFEVGNTPFFLLHGRDARLPLDVLFAPHADELCEQDYAQYNIAHSRILHKAYKEAHQRQKIAMEKRKEYYDKRVTPVQFKIGDLVVLYTPVTTPGESKKLTLQWTGPHRVEQKLSSLLYQIRDIHTNRTQRVHVHRLKRLQLTEEEAKRQASLPSSGSTFLENKLSDNKNDPPEEKKNNRTTMTIEQMADKGYYVVEKILGRRPKAKGKGYEYLVQWQIDGSTSWESKSNLRTVRHMIQAYEDGFHRN